MKLKVQVEDQEFIINVGSGLNDFAWLALAAAKLYGKKKSPTAHFLPAYLKIIDYVPHPRTRINVSFKDFTQENLEEVVVTVELYKSNMILTQEHTKWFEEAYGKERNIMSIQCEYYYEKLEKKKLDKVPEVSVQITYEMFKELKADYPASEYPQYNKQKHLISLLPEQNPQPDKTLLECSGELSLPYGKVEFEVVQKVKHDDQVVWEKIDQSKLGNYFKHKIVPEPISQEECLKLIKDQMKIPEQLSQQLQSQETEAKKDQQSGQLCPFNHESLWSMIEQNPQNDVVQQSNPEVKQKISKIIQENMVKLYEIFFSYAVLYKQKTEKRDEFVITLQDVMHFLKFYEVLQDSNTLFTFIDIIDHNGQKSQNIQSTLSLDQGLQFHEFIIVILKAANQRYPQENMEKNESIDQALEIIINNIINIESHDESFNEFHKHMKYDSTLIYFLQDKSSQFIKIFCELLLESIQVANKKYHLLREEIKKLILEAGFKGENLDYIVNTCFNEFTQQEKYSGYEGVFYYDFLQMMQWLSLALIADAEEEEAKQQQEESQEEGVDVLIEKLKFFLNQFK